MKTNSIFQFLVIISPSEALRQYTFYKKEYLRKHLGNFESASSIPHITLFNYEDKHNDSRLYELEQQITQFTSFNLYTTNYNFFRHGNNATIYIDFIHKAPACNIAEELDHRKITPHLTIAKNLKPHEFNKAWSLLKDDSFQFSFQCNYITVLKREPGYFWQNYTNLYFNK